MQCISFGLVMKYDWGLRSTPTLNICVEHSSGLWLSVKSCNE